MSSLQYGVGMFPTESISRIIHLSKQAEDLGYSHIWVGDSHLIWREAFVNMAAVALNTSKVIIGTGVTNPVTRHPSVLASGYATLDEMAPGRFAVGIGLGDSSLETMGRKQARLAEFEEAVAQMRAVIEGGEAELESGSKIHLNSAQNRKIPFYAAASGPKMLELSGPHRRRRDHPGGGGFRRHRKGGGEDRGRRGVGGPQALRHRPGAVGAVRGFRESRCQGRGEGPRGPGHRPPAALHPGRARAEGPRRHPPSLQLLSAHGPARRPGTGDPGLAGGQSSRSPAPRTSAKPRSQELKQSAINQVAIIPYNVGDADRGETLRLFAGAM